MHAERVSKDFEIKNLGEYHDFYVQSDTLLLADVFNSLRNMCLKIYGSYPAHFLFSTMICMSSNLKKDQNKFRYINCYQYVINGRKRYRRWNTPCCSSIWEN